MSESNYKDTKIGFVPPKDKELYSWDRMENESIKAFECFCVYLLMGI